MCIFPPVAGGEAAKRDYCELGSLGCALRWQNQRLDSRSGFRIPPSTTAREDEEEEGPGTPVGENSKYLSAGDEKGGRRPPQLKPSSLADK